MILALLLAFAASASSGPVLPYAEARSIAYRDCVAAQRSRRPAGASAAELGHGPCARARSRLFAEVRDHVSYGWLATAKTAGQTKRMRAQLKQRAEEVVAGFEGEVQAWLTAGAPTRAGEGSAG